MLTCSISFIRSASLSARCSAVIPFEVKLQILEGGGGRKRPSGLHVYRCLKVGERTMFVKHKLFPVADLPASGWTTARWEATRTTSGTRPPWGSSTPSRLLTIRICTRTPTHSWSWCLSSSKTCAGSKRSFIMRRGCGLPRCLYVFQSLFGFAFSIWSLQLWGDFLIFPSEPLNTLLSLHIQGQKRFLETASSDLVGGCQ